MDQAIDRTGTEACAKRTLVGVTRTGVLLTGAVLASILAVELPLPAGQAAEGAAYVPASDRWIELGAETAPLTPPPLPAGR